MLIDRYLFIWRHGEGSSLCPYVGNPNSIPPHIHTPWFWISSSLWSFFTKGDYIYLSDCINLLSFKKVVNKWHLEIWRTEQGHWLKQESIEWLVKVFDYRIIHINQQSSDETFLPFKVFIYYQFCLIVITGLLRPSFFLILNASLTICNRHKVLEYQE